MKFNIISEDLEYVEALECYYALHYQNDMNVVFNDEDTVNYIVISDEWICDQGLVLGQLNQVMTKEIKKYQSAKSFFTYLKNLRMEDFIQDIPFRTFAFVNALSGSGATTLALNLSDALSSRGKTLFLSLEKASSTMFYMDKKSGISLSDIFFYFSYDPKLLESKLNEWQMTGFYWFDPVEHQEDLKAIDGQLINQLMDFLKQADFSYVVLDLGNKPDCNDIFQADNDLFVMTYCHNHFYRVGSLVHEKNLCINKRRHDMYLNESYIRSAKSSFYVDLDFELEEERTWRSKAIQSAILKHLNMI